MLEGEVWLQVLRCGSTPPRTVWQDLSYRNKGAKHGMFGDEGRHVPHVMFLVCVTDLYLASSETLVVGPHSVVAK